MISQGLAFIMGIVVRWMFDGFLVQLYSFRIGLLYPGCARGGFEHWSDFGIGGDF